MLKEANHYAYNACLGSLKCIKKLFYVPLDKCQLKEELKTLLEPEPDPDTY